MSALICAGLIGDGAVADDLIRYGAPLEGVRLTHWWQGGGADAGRAGALGAALAAEWQSLAHDPDLEALIVLPGDHALAAARAGLAGGKIVLCPGVCAHDEAGLDSLVAAGGQNGGMLLSVGELSFTDAARHARAVLASGAMGPVHNLYLAVRAPYAPAGAPSVLEALGWEAWRFVLDCFPGDLQQVFAAGRRLFGEGSTPDAVIVMARFAPDVVVTIEMAQCLPPTIPASRHGEVEFEIIGQAETLRGVPFNTAVKHYGQTTLSALVWTDDPVIAMLAELPRAAAGLIARDRDIIANRRLIALMDKVRLSLAEERCVLADG